MTFPIGLLFLLITNTATVTVALEPEKSGTSSALRASANRRSVRPSSPWRCSHLFLMALAYAVTRGGPR